MHKALLALRQCDVAGADQAFYPPLHRVLGPGAVWAFPSQRRRIAWFSVAPAGGQRDDVVQFEVRSGAANVCQQVALDLVGVCHGRAHRLCPPPGADGLADVVLGDLGVGDLGGREEGEEGVRQGGECAVRGASLFAANLGISPKWGIFVSSQLTEDGRQMGIFILRTYIDFWLF